MLLEALKDITKPYDVITVGFPIFRISEYKDYHIVKQDADLLSDVSGKKIKGMEIDIEDYGYKFTGEYSGVFYISKKPTKQEIRAAIDSVAKDYRLQKLED